MITEDTDNINIKLQTASNNYINCINAVNQVFDYYLKGFDEKLDMAEVLFAMAKNGQFKND